MASNWSLIILISFNCLWKEDFGARLHGSTAGALLIMLHGAKDPSTWDPGASDAMVPWEPQG